MHRTSRTRHINVTAILAGVGLLVASLGEVARAQSEDASTEEGAVSELEKAIEKKWGAYWYRPGRIADEKEEAEADDAKAQANPADASAASQQIIGETDATSVRPPARSLRSMEGEVGAHTKSPMQEPEAPVQP